MFSSLVTRLTLAVLAALLLSLGVTTTVFVTQLHSDDRAAARQTLRINELAVDKLVFAALLNATDPQRPLARIDRSRLPITRVLLTRWPDSAVVGDSASNGGPPAGPIREPIVYHGLEATGDVTVDGADYRYVAVPVPLDLPLATNTPYRDIIMLQQVTALPARAWAVIRTLAQAGAIAIAVSLLAALLVLRRITRPLHGMTLASERMAAGDYDQRVAGADSSDEVGQLARSFNRMSQEVKRVREMQRQFIANVSHDLRSPLTSIIGFSQALTEDRNVTPAQRRLADIINGEAQRLYRLTMDLLDLSRLEAGRLTLSKAPLDLNAVLHDVAARYSALPNKRGVRFVDSLCGGILPVLGDADRLTQVAVNLLDNALKFCDPGAEVRLSSRRDGNSAVFEVYNSGAGIAPSDLPRVFDRFYRGDHSRAQQTGGSGIGLAIVRELVAAHGGQITADSQLGAWTVMTVRLPLVAGTTFTKDLHAANTDATSLAV